MTREEKVFQVMFKKFPDLIIDIAGNIHWEIDKNFEDKYNKEAIAYADAKNRRIFLNTKNINKYIGNNEKSYILVILHELLHIKLNHYLRRENRDKEIWNIATDVEIHSIIRKIDESLYEIANKKGVTFENVNEKLRNESSSERICEEDSAEEIYDKIVKELKPKKLIIKIIDENQIKDEAITGDESEGKSTESEVINPYNTESLESQLKKAGLRSGNSLLGKIKKALLKEKPDIAKYIIKQIKNNEGNSKRTYSKINPTAASNMCILPSRIGNNKEAKVLLGIDTSASINDKELGLVYSFSEELIKSINKIDIVTCDTEINNVEKIKSKSDLKRLFERNIKGGGGTNMNPLVEYADKKKYDYFILVTDGYLFEDLKPQKNGTKRFVVLYKRSHSLDNVRGERIFYLD